MNNKKTNKKLKKLWTPVGLSFKVIRIIEQIDGDVVYYDTILREYSGGEIISYRGNPWPIGSKIDFEFSACESPSTQNPLKISP